MEPLIFRKGYVKVAFMRLFQLLVNAILTNGWNITSSLLNIN